MSATFTDDDREKTVENANGEVIGTVTSIEDDTAHVKPSAGIVDSIRATLGWRRGQGETMAIHEDTVDEISSEAIRLESESVEEIDAEQSDESEQAPVDEAGSAGTSLDEPERQPRDEGGRYKAGDATPPSEIEPEDPADATPTPDIEADNAAEREPGTESEAGGAGAPEQLAEMDESTTGNAAERSEDPTVPDGIEEMETPPNAESDDESSELPDETAETDAGLEADEITEGSEATDDPVNVGGETARAAETEVTEDLAGESDDPYRPPESDDAPDAMSDTRSESSTETMDRADMQEMPMGETEEMTDTADEAPTAPDKQEDELADMSPETMDESSGEESASVEESDPADELDPGVDIESAAGDIESEGSGESDLERTTETDDVADEMDPSVDIESAAATGGDDLESVGGTSGSDSTTGAEEIDPGVDIESATSTESDSAEADPRPETELDPAVGDDYAETETDPRPETELDAEHDDEYTTTTDQPSGTDVVPDTDLESAVDADREAESEIDPDTIAGQRSGPEMGDESAAREVVPEAAAATSREMESSADDGSATDTETDLDSGEGRRTASPLSAVLATQRATMTSGQELLKGGLTVQQQAARSAVEAPLRGQRQGIELTQAATRRYFDALDSMVGMDASESEDDQQSIYDAGRQSMDEAVAELEAAHSQQRDATLASDLEAHLEELQTLQAQIAEQVEPGSEQAAALLERQIELLEACRERLDAN